MQTVTTLDTYLKQKSNHIFKRKREGKNIQKSSWRIYLTHAFAPQPQFYISLFHEFYLPEIRINPMTQQISNRVFILAVCQPPCFNKRQVTLEIRIKTGSASPMLPLLRRIPVRGIPQLEGISQWNVNTISFSANERRPAWWHSRFTWPLSIGQTLAMHYRAGFPMMHYASAEDSGSLESLHGDVIFFLTAKKF